MVLERRHFLQMRQAAITIQVLHELKSLGVEAARVVHAWPLNTCPALRPAGDPTVFDGLWRGHRQPSTSRPHGGATGIGWPTSARDRTSSACRASAGGTCSARGEQNRALPLRMFQKPESLLTLKLPEIQVEVSEYHSECRKAGKGLVGIQPSGHTNPRGTSQGWWAVLTAKPQTTISYIWSPPGNPAPAHPRPVSGAPAIGGGRFRPPWTNPQWAPLPPHSHMELGCLPGQGPQRNSGVS